MARYSFVYSSTAVTGSENVMGIKTGLAGAGVAGISLYEVLISGQAGTSTPVRLDVNRPSGTAGAAEFAGVSVPAGRLAPMTSPAAVLTGHRAAYTTAATAGTSLVSLPFNAFGGIIRWVAAPGSEVIAIGTSTGPSQAIVLITSKAGSATVDAHMMVEEL